MVKKNNDMKIKVIISFFSIILIINNLNGAKNPQMNSIVFFSPKNFNNFYFISVGGNSILDIYKTPNLGFDYSNVSQGYILPSPISSSSISLFKLQLNQRINIFQLNDALSLSVNMPLAVSFNFTNGYIYPVPAYVFYLPAFVQLNLFNKATKFSFNRVGFNIGFGYQYFLYPYINRQESYYDEAAVVNNKMKIVKAEFLFNDKTQNSHGISFFFGLDTKKVFYEYELDNGNNTRSIITNFFMSINYLYNF